jgi:tetratricopeptide (TPR) repeat protein
LFQGRYDHATYTGTEGLQLYRQLNDTASIALATQTLGTAALEQGHYQQALPLLEESLRHYRQLKADGGVASSLNLLGQVALGQGQVAQSLACFTESLALLQGIEQLHGLAWTSRNLGQAHLAAGDVDQAEADFWQALKYYQRADSLGGIAVVLEGLAGVAALRNQARYAAQLVGAASIIREELGLFISPHSQHIYQGQLAPAQVQLSSIEWATELAHGRGLPLETLLAEIDQ